MRLIADGAVERSGVSGLARRLGYSERHLNRVMTDELGAGPLAVARAHRAHTARLLIETTAMTFTDIAFAAGFGSVRQFNDTVREVFDSAPTELRRRRTASAASTPGEVTLRLPTRQPFAGDELMSFLGAHAIPGLESWDGETFRSVLSLPNGHGVAALRATRRSRRGHGPPRIVGRSRDRRPTSSSTPRPRRRPDRGGWRIGRPLGDRSTGGAGAGPTCVCQRRSDPDGAACGDRPTGLARRRSHGDGAIGRRRSASRSPRPSPPAPN